jgi:hypothetical protein
MGLEPFSADIPRLSFLMGKPPCGIFELLQFGGLAGTITWQDKNKTA